MPWQLIHLTSTSAPSTCQEHFKCDRSSFVLHHTDANLPMYQCCEEYDLLFQAASNLQSRKKTKNNIPFSKL